MMAQNELTASKVVLNKLMPTITLGTVDYDIPYWGAFDQHFGTKLHQHHFCEVTLITAGTGTYVENGRRYPLKPDSLIITKPEVMHQIISTNGVGMLYFAFFPEAQEMSNLAAVTDLSPKDPVVLTWNALAYMALVYQEAGERGEQSVRLLGTSLLQLLFDRQFNNQDLDHLLVAISAQTDLLAEIKQYIRDHLDQHLSIGSIAEVFFISKRQLFRLFKKYESCTCNQYVQRARVKAAAELIRTTKTSITDISDQVGFSSVHYFSKVFKDNMRDTPQKFRQLYSNALTDTFSKEN